MSKKDNEPDLLFPFDTEEAAKTGICCPNPKCLNDGMDGSITGRGGQWGIQRMCKKCGQTWSGGIGVQRPDHSEPMPVAGVDTTGDDVPIRDNNSSFRTSDKNYSGDE